MRRLANDFTHSLTEHVAGMQITDEIEVTLADTNISSPGHVRPDREADR